ncbi:hypothetical protein RND81_13G202900 [Saponaria officinalis]|uniref:Uncharacterized protein n=1 Tax=Saponaria officinalis TaxID=3572 RepID=A0AAW1H550_SAPOF
MDESCMKCELRVIAAKNIKTNLKCSFFIRCYISGANNRRIQLNTKEIMSTKIVDDDNNDDDDYLFWNEIFSLECNGAQNSINNLKEENIVFELRQRNTNPNFLTKLGGSSSSVLLARAEIPWKGVFDAPGMETLRWVSMTSAEKVKCEECCMTPLLPPALQVGVKVETLDLSRKMSSEETKRRRRLERLKNWDGCGCSLGDGGCCSCVDNELLFVGECLEHF